MAANDVDHVEGDLELGEGEPLYESSAPAVAPVYVSITPLVSCQLIVFKSY